MADEFKNESTEIAYQTPNKTRRTFVRTAAQVAVTVPVATLLLNAATKPASASCPYGNELVPCKILDDFTFGNLQEDIDAKAGNTDLTNFGGGKESQDDASNVDHL